MRDALACVEVNLAAFVRILERKGLVATAAAGNEPTAEENLVEASGLRELMALGRDLRPRSSCQGIEKGAVYRCLNK